VNKAVRGHYNSFDDFWPEFLAASNLAKEKKASGPVIKLLNRQSGFVPNEDQVRKLYQCIRELPNPESLEFSLLLTARTRRMPSRVVAALADHVFLSYKEVSAFPDIEAATWVDVREWIVARLSVAISEKQDVLAIGRAMFSSLLRLRDRDFYTNSLLLLSAQIEGKQRKRDSEQNEIEAVLGELLTRHKLNRKQLALIGRASRAMRNAVDSATDQRRQAMARADALQQDIAKLQAELKEKKTEIDECCKMITTLKNGLSAAQEDLANAQGRVAGTEEHWSVIAKQQLAGAVSKLQDEIGHETREIVLCLDRATPNGDMALQRARRIEKILEKANSAK